MMIDFDPWPRYDRPPAVVFVDVDGTLLAETTTLLYAKILLERGLIDRTFVLRAAYHGLQHRFGRLDYATLVNFGLNRISTIPVDQLERIAYENFVDHIRPRLFPGVVDHLNALRMAGSLIVLVSSSPRIVLEPLSIYLGCEDMLTTPVRIERGHLVGIADGPACYGVGKLEWAGRWAGDRGIAMDSTAAYADNWSDRALLGQVGRAVAVNPRRKLRKLALSRGWTIVRPRRVPAPRS